MFIISGDAPKTGVLKETAIPHIFQWSKSETTAKLNRIRSALKRADRQKRFQMDDEIVCQNIGNEETIEELQPIVNGQLHSLK